MDEEVALGVWGSGTRPSKASLHDGIVFRRPAPWSNTVIALLRHLEAEGFQGAPRVIGSGFAEDGREMISFVEGTTPHPRPWTDQAMATIGDLLRQLHVAAATFRAPTDACWRPWFARQLPGSRPVLGHGDTGPWNIIERDGAPVAFIDWEFAGPIDAVWELAEVAWLNAQLYDDDIAERVGLGPVTARAAQVRTLLDA